MTTSASSSSTQKEGGTTSPSKGGRRPPAIAASSSCPGDQRSVAAQRRDELEVARLGELIDGRHARDTVAGGAQRDEVQTRTSLLGIDIARVKLGLVFTALRAPLFGQNDDVKRCLGIALLLGACAGPARVIRHEPTGTSSVSPPAPHRKVALDPAGDADGDGIPNGVDKCPNQP